LDIKELTERIVTGSIYEGEIHEVMKDAPMSNIPNIKILKLVNGWEIHQRVDAVNVN
jgi:hypothetical protein